ncbi:hypothetical protein DNTS_030028 [Danionella cerebrum]|uniref:G protein-regulated inducer of neurite outgrowth C-terminal domain-containing protein n=1 Tax=Danionella cerebrum TaxID=2873325 RepID=A0A553NRV0_9TELE|nr:hypothetical protein DNTS_030028 [Danionella translucida]
MRQEVNENERERKGWEMTAKLGMPSANICTKWYRRWQLEHHCTPSSQYSPPPPIWMTAEVFFERVDGSLMAKSGHTMSFPQGGRISPEEVVPVESSSTEIKPIDVLIKTNDAPMMSPKDNNSQIDPHHLSPRKITETHTSESLSVQPMGFPNSHECYGSQTVHRDLKNHKLPIQRCHSDSLQIVKDTATSTLYCETGTSFCQGREQDACAQSFPPLVYKQAMPLQQCNTVTTSTRAGSNSPTQPTEHSFIQICEVIPESTCHRCEESVYCHSHVPHGAVKDTFAAYCHPQPIPAPAQLLPHLVGMEEVCKRQLPAGNLLALPRLISSVSETGLDGKRLLRCCNLDCSWSGQVHPFGAQQWVEEKSMKEVGTMTLQKHLRDVGVQVDQDSEKHPQHVFPKVCLIEEKKSKSQKSPVREVKWDAEGMTWEVYGASVDPEELGIAIQKHLEIQIKETKGLAAKLSRQNTTTSQQSSGSTQKIKKGLLGSLRHPACCSGTTGTVD